jgi:N-acetylmuramic acid 6-phosphate etherase
MFDVGRSMFDVRRRMFEHHPCVPDQNVEHRTSNAEHRSGDGSARILGIEGGGTKTEWVLLDEAQAVLESGRLPASNMRLIDDARLTQLFAALPAEATHVGAFLAGCATEEDEARLRRLAAAVWPQARLAIGSDRDSGMAAAFRDGDGIAVISGTGAAVHGRKGGAIEKAGGWGQLLGDRGGGYDLAMQGLRLVLTHYDLEREITPLGQEILRLLGLNRLHDLVGWAMRADKMSVAQLAPAVFRAARFGDAAMLATIEGGAQVLAQYTRAVAQRLEFPAPEVKLIGGIFGYHPEYVSLFTLRLSTMLPGAKVSVCTESGAMGAAWLATEQPAARRFPLPAHRPAAGGTPELARAATEQAHPAAAALETRTSADLVALFIAEEDRVAEALAACREKLIAAVDIVSASLRASGRLFYIGAGTSGRLGVLDASEIPPTFGADPSAVQGIIAGGATALQHAVEGAEDEPRAGALAIVERGLRAGDVACGIAASGRTPFVLGALARARELGARTILLTCNPARVVSAAPWDVEIDLPTGPEIVTGSTRLKAGTATKVALNILSTCAMIRLGKVRGGAMIDLRISNEKLRDRGARIVAEALGLGYDEARARLEAAEWDVRACLGK